MNLNQGIVLSAAIMLAGTAQAATFVYVSNPEDGNIGMYEMRPDGTLKPGEKFEAGGKPVNPMSISPDKKFLYAAVRSKPFTAVTFAIDHKTGALKKVATAPLAESVPYIHVDKSGHFLLSASFMGNLVSVNPIGKDGRVAPPTQVVPTGRHAHSIITDNTGEWVFAAHLGTDQIFQFRLDKKTGKLVANTPATVQLKLGSGPRHIIMSPDNKFAYLLSEMVGTITTLSLDAKTGLLTEVSSAAILPADSKLVPGSVRLPPVAGQPPKDMSKDIWASDLHITPDGKFLYATERTTSSIGAFSVDRATGKLTWLSSTPTEKQPRGFRIDPKGKYMVVSGEKSETISVYEIDGSTGALKMLQKYPTGKGSNWVEIVSF
ncbi:MAG TPA: beta-propeller fold lactonase family protein [Polyangia bacterium]|jgi:6-phosphogluconolactonase|nr:beta-propeller fold lactonase family protein [Polyangia bacterium]